MGDNSRRWGYTDVTHHFDLYGVCHDVAAPVDSRSAANTVVVGETTPALLLVLDLRAVPTVALDRVM